ncbi:Type IV secretion system protein VirB10 [Candidatus Phycorickettsia trachydisci]|uniref:Type IV secretion system protein VirB10 n=1 Tax=Candidatus Phycorickettsia trachydisci TaxID=2115978 RepID=A0A2P1P9E5_9RICK|nr:TrbI/VirB10 family protein [Candidatus Phycorickettsia trachydisci]AVP87870.1 Type IV secretion system protein VirB10 [Candidatus Phycorickettsia trachydisci]
MADNNTNSASSVKSALRHNLSLVASSSKKSVAILVVIVGILGYVLYATIFSLSGPAQNELVKTKQPPKPPENVVVPDSNVIAATPQVPDIPAIPQLVKPAPPAPPPAPKKEPEEKKDDASGKPTSVATVTPNAPVAPVAPIAPPTPPRPSGPSSTADFEAKRKANIMLINNPPKTAAAVEQAQIVQDNSFKTRSDLKYVLGKGKIMEIILETAINTDQTGEIRGIVTRDVFAEDHKTRLIPKGSKIFGTFSNSVDQVYGILKVNWTRVDFATGYTLQLASAGSIDNLGRTGIVGRLDNKYKEQIMQNALSSAISIGLAQMTDKLITGSINTVGAQKYGSLASSLSTLNTTFVTQMATLTTATTLAAAQAKLNDTCQTARGYFFDTTASVYTDFDAACKKILAESTTDNYSTQTTELSTALQTASSAASSLSTTNTATTLTNTQNAVKTAIQSLTTQVQGFTANKTFSPNITISQGELIRVYIDQDYTFPAKAVGSFTSVLQ